MKGALRCMIILVLFCAMEVYPADAIGGSSSLDSLRVKSSMWSLKVYQGERELKIHKELRPVMEYDQQAYAKYRGAPGLMTLTNIAAGAGGFLIGFPLGSAIGGSDNPHWELAAVGGGLALIALVVNGKHNKVVEEAVSIYNRNLSLREER